MNVFLITCAFSIVISENFSYSFQHEICFCQSVMQFHRILLLLTYCMWMIIFTYGLECQLSGEYYDTSTLLRSTIDKNRIRRQMDDVEACYMTIKIDFITKEYSVYYSDSLTDGDKGTEHGSFQMITKVTFDQDSTVINDSEHVQGVMTYTCKDSSGCNKKNGFNGSDGCENDLNRRYSSYFVAYF